MRLTDSFAWLLHRSYAANIPKFFVFRFLWEFMLFLPIWVIFLQEVRGFSLTQVTLLDTAFWLIVVAGEVPTGAVADTWGRKQSLIIGVLLAAVSISLFALAPTYPLLLLANSLWALGFTFDSGAALALLYDSLREAGREEEYTRLRGRLAVVQHAAIACSSVLGGVLGTLDLRLPFVVYAALLLAALGLVLRFQEPPREADPATGKPPGYARILTCTAQALGQHPGLRYALLYANLLPLAIGVVGVVFLQPHARALGVPVVGMGFLVLGLHGIRMAGSAASYRLVTRFGESTWLRLAPVAVFAGMMGLGMVHALWGIAFLGLVGFATSATGPLVETIILRQAPNSVRATILSVDSLIFRLLWAVAEPGLGVLGDRYGLPTAFLTLGLGSGAGMLVVLLLWTRAQRAPQRVMPT
jgi:MFS family permease